MPIGHRGAGMRKVLFGDNDESSSVGEVPMVDEPVGQQHRLQSLKGVQLWEWRQLILREHGLAKAHFQRWWSNVKQREWLRLGEPLALAGEPMGEAAVRVRQTEGQHTVCSVRDSVEFLWWRRQS